MTCPDCEQLRQEVEELKILMLAQQKKIEALEKELRKYKNANTPSSANKHLKGNTNGLKARNGARRGAPKGHRGATLKLPPPDEVIPVSACECVECHSTNIRPTGDVKEKHVICLQKPKMILKKYKQAEYVCQDCFNLFLANHAGIPSVGIYDNNVQSFVNYLRFKSRMSLGLVVDAMNNVFEVPMTEPTCLEITRRASEKLEPEYENLEEEIRKEKVVHGDETSHSVDGINQWIWVFCTALKSLFKFHDQRGGDIVENTLGKNFEGVLVVDGWSTYKAYSEKHKKVLLQRCWGHGIREVKHECKKKYPRVYKNYCHIYGLAKKAKEYKQDKRRLDAYEECKTLLGQWCDHAENFKSLKKLAGKIRNGGDNWFTAILYPEVPLDNNEAERSLRPLVVMRKIIGCLRSQAGVKTHETMMSLISTWEKQNKNVFYTLQNTL